MAQWIRPDMDGARIREGRRGVIPLTVRTYALAEARRKSEDVSHRARLNGNGTCPNGHSDEPRYTPNA
ncbi:MAG: hypothetical protein HYW25_00570 [Candidatus Aenigmarchaeota archaeon]|nr:hypothetical protein [Candidatus Aenigmarchaeota archaeon]